MKKKVIYSYSSEELFQIRKDRYNPFQTGSGMVVSSVDKAKNRRSKQSQKFKNELRQYCL